MSAALRTKAFANSGFSVIELLLVVAMIAVITGFFLVNLVSDRRTTFRTKTAIELANHLQKARADSIRRNAREPNQMAQVKVFNRRFYSVAVDSDGDSHLDIPLVMSLPEEQGVEINGPFPKIYIFDWLGQPVDEQNTRVVPQPISVTNKSGASVIKFSETGAVIVVPATKTVSNR